MLITNNLSVSGPLSLSSVSSTTTSFSALVLESGLVKSRNLGSISLKGDNEYLPQISLSFPNIFNLNTSTLNFTNQSLTVSLTNQPAKTFLAAPNNLAGTPSFRAILASDIPTLNQNTTGNAATATTLQTPRTLTIGNTGKSFDGSGNVSWSLAEIGAQSILTNPVTGTGTTNYIPKFTAGGTIGNSQIYDNGTNVGIGIAPSQKLEVNGNVKANSFIKSGGTATQILMADGSITEKSTIANQTLSTSIDNNGRYLSISGGNQVNIDSRLIHVLDSPNRNPNDPLFYPNVTGKSVRFDFISSGHVVGTGNYAGLMTFSPWDGTTNSTGDSSYQLAFYNQTGINGTGIPGLKIRKGIDTTWNSWYKIYTDGDFTQSNIDNWNAAYGWGNHSNAGYALANGTNATDNWSNTSSGLALNPRLSGKTLNASGQTVDLRDATYGQISGIVQDDTNGPIPGYWSNRLKTLHNNSVGYFTELAQNFTGNEGVWHRRNSAGTISSWKQLYDDSIWNAASLSYSGSTLTLTINGISKTTTINTGSTYTAGTNISISSNQVSVVSAPTFTGSVTASSFYETSLRKYKTNIKKFDKSGIDLVDSLEIVTFDRIDSDVKSKIGIIADDTSDEFLSEQKDAIDLYKTVFIQAKAIQELNAKNLELEERLIKLEKLLSNG